MAKKQQLQGEVMNKYIMQKSSTRPKGWVIIDTENLIVIRFEYGKLGETKDVAILDDSKLRTLSRVELATEVPKITRPIVDWAMKNYKSRCFKYYEPTK